MSKLEEVLSEHFEEEEVEGIATILRMGVSYTEGNRFAGARLSSIPGEDWQSLNEMFEEAGFDTEISGRMSLISFINDPNTEDTNLNRVIKGL